MKEYIEINPISVKEGIAETVKWYSSNKKEADAKK